MNIFKRIDTGLGFPLYYQRMPEMIKSVALQWLIFTGAADDESVGLPGLHHWFEHVPFRGTIKYPSGYQSIQAPFLDYAGSIDAWTNHEATNYGAFIPLPAWKQALSVITDLFCQPLITDKGVASEREIIYQEIVKARSKFERRCFQGLYQLLLHGHPAGHDVLGTEESLRSMQPSTLRSAHMRGYDISRCALFVAGNIDESEILTELQGLLGILPRRGLSPRTGPVSRGKVEWMTQEHITIHTEFESSMIMAIFPLTGTMEQNYHDARFLRSIFAYGNMASPMFRVIRDQRNLVYSAHPFFQQNMDCSVFGFAAEAKKENIVPVIKAFRDLLADEQLATKGRIANIVSGAQYSWDMEPVCPDSYVEHAVGTIMSSGRVINEDEARERIVSRTTTEAERVLSLLDPTLARTVVFEGTV